MGTRNMSWQSLDYLKLVERALFHRQIGFKIFRNNLNLPKPHFISCSLSDWETCGYHSLFYNWKEINKSKYYIEYKVCQMFSVRYIER